MAANQDYEIEEAAISPFAILKADELFLISNASGIQPITKYRRAKFKTTHTEKSTSCCAKIFQISKNKEV